MTQLTGMFFFAGWPCCTAAVSQSDSGICNQLLQFTPGYCCCRLMESEAGERPRPAEGRHNGTFCQKGVWDKNFNGQANKGWGRSRRRFSGLAAEKPFWNQQSHRLTICHECMTPVPKELGLRRDMCACVYLYPHTKYLFAIIMW